MSTAQILFDGVVKLAEIWAPFLVLAFVADRVLGGRHG
jgi:hypothetical protein